MNANVPDLAHHDQGRPQRARRQPQGLLPHGRGRRRRLGRPRQPAGPPDRGADRLQPSPSTPSCAGSSATATGTRRSSSSPPTTRPATCGAPAPAPTRPATAPGRHSSTTVRTPSPAVQWNSGDHTNSLVPLFAKGPGAPSTAPPPRRHRPRARQVPRQHRHRQGDSRRHAVGDLYTQLLEAGRGGRDGRPRLRVTTPEEKRDRSATTHEDRRHPGPGIARRAGARRASSRAGMDVARINLSHGTTAEHERDHRAVRRGRGAARRRRSRCSSTSPAPSCGSATCHSRSTVRAGRGRRALGALSGRTAAGQLPGAAAALHGRRARPRRRRRRRPAGDAPSRRRPSPSRCCNDGTIESRKGVNLPDTQLPIGALTEVDRESAGMGPAAGRRLRGALVRAHRR